jgi:hypothetical protein
LTKTEEEETIIIKRPNRSTHPEEKSVLRSGATPEVPHRIDNATPSSFKRRWITLIVRHETNGKRRRLSVAVIEDEGRPLGAGWQREASNQAVRLGPKRRWS